MSSFGSVGRICLCLTAFGIVSNCGVATIPTSKAQPDKEFAIALYNAQVNYGRSASLLEIDRNSVPNTGTASYTGDSLLRVVSASGIDFRLLGSSTIPADFQSGTISGSLTGFRGGPLDPGLTAINFLDSAVESYSGTITVSGAQKSNRLSAFEADFYGTLTAPSQTIDASGILLGTLRKQFCL